MSMNVQHHQEKWCCAQDRSWSRRVCSLPPPKNQLKINFRTILPQEKEVGLMAPRTRPGQRPKKEPCICSNSMQTVGKSVQYLWTRGNRQASHMNSAGTSDTVMSPRMPWRIFVNGSPSTCCTRPSLPGRGGTTTSGGIDPLK